MKTAAKQQRGFSLTEALVSLVVISVGMIGMAALYGEGLTAGSTALFRTVAVNLASDMADRVRINRLGGVAYEGAAANNHCDPEHGPVASCDPAKMAAHDVFVWKEQLAAQLPSGTGTIKYNPATNPATFTIKVTWQEPGVNAVDYQTVIQVPPF